MPLKFPKPTSRAQGKREKAAATRRTLAEVHRAVMARDGHRCRVCGRRQDVEMHHIQFRSMGGGHSLQNCAALCAVCHADIHAYRLVIHGTDANKRLRFERL